MGPTESKGHGAAQEPPDSGGLLGGPPGLPWKRLAGAALVAAAGAVGAVFALSSIDLVRGATDTWLRIGAGTLSLSGGLLGLMEFHRRRTRDIARGRVAGPMVGHEPGRSAFRTAIGLALTLLAVATVLATGVDVAVQMSSAATENGRSGLDALREARNRKDPRAETLGEAESSGDNPGRPSLVAPDTSGRSRGAVNEEALGNLLSDVPVFEVIDVSGGGPFERPLLLRGFIVESFDSSGTFRERSGNSVALGARDAAQIDRPYGTEDPPVSPPGGKLLDLEFRFFGATQGLVFSPHELLRLNAGRAQLDEGTLALTASLADRRTYSLRARVPSLGRGAIARATARGSLPAGHGSLSLPPVVTEERRRAGVELDRLAREVTRGAGSDLGRVLAIVQHLRTAFAYELYHLDFLNPEGCTQLLDRGAGSCTHFASMATILLRRLGIPTRIAAGYVAREPLSGDSGWLVRERDGHAWIEVHFKGIGWLPFDPTPGDATVGGALEGWSPLEAALEARSARGRGGAGTTALASVARAAMAALQRQGISGGWLLMGAMGAVSLWALGRRKRSPRHLDAEAQNGESPVLRAGGGGDDPAVLDLLDALKERGFVQPRGATPRAFARSVEDALPEAQGLEASVFVMLRAAAGRGAMQPGERTALSALTARIRAAASPSPPC